MRTERLPVTLTNDEVRVRGEELAGLVAEINEAEDAKKLAASEAKAAIDALDSKAAGIAEEIRSRRVYRDVEVREDLDAPSRVVSVIRLDTGEVVRERVATSSDLQAVFPKLAEVHQILDENSARLDDLARRAVERSGAKGE